MHATPALPVPAAAMADDKNFVTSLAKGLEVLTCFSRARARLTVSEVARATGCTPASARRSLLTLHALDYLGSDGKLYWMQPKALRVANAYLSSSATPQAAQPLLDALSERTRESASLAQLVGDDVIITGGKKVDPFIVEEAARASGQFKDLAVIGAPDSKWGQAVILCYPASQDAPDEGLVKEAFSKLALHERPKRVLAVSPWPRNAQGKVNRSELAKAVQASETSP